MASPEQILEAATFAALLAAMLIFLGLISSKVRRGSRLRGDFTFLLWAFIVGWMAAELLQILAPESLDPLSESVHFAVVLLFAIFLGLRWRWAMRTAAGEVAG